MREIIDEIESLNLELRPPASVDLILKLRGEFVDLPHELIALFQHHNGSDADCYLPMRLLPIEEVIETTKELRSIPELVGNKSFQPVFCWTDDNSNYAGIFVDTELSGRVFILDHDDCPAIPAFRSVRSYYEQLLIVRKSDQDWYELTRDYPSLNADDVTFESEADTALARNYLDLYLSGDPENDSIWAFYAMALSGFKDSELIMQLLDSSNMWVQERACKLLGQRRCVAAIPRLRDVALNGMHNGRSASVLALKNMNTPEASKVISELKPKMENKFGYLFR